MNFLIQKLAVRVHFRKFYMQLNICQFSFISGYMQNNGKSGQIQVESGQVRHQITQYNELIHQGICWE